MVAETITNTEEAMAVLKKTRAEQIRIAREVADDLIAAHGSTYTRPVRAEMIRRGLFDRSIPEFWLGAIFRTSRYVFTGDYAQVAAEAGDGDRNIHDRKIVKIWTWR